MKKLLILLIPVLLFGCSNMFNTDANLNIITNLHPDGTREATTASFLTAENVTRMELWISDSDVDYWLVEPEDTVTGSDILITENEEVTEPSIIRYIESASSILEVQVRTNKTKTFTLRVEFSDGIYSRVFIGVQEAYIIDGQENMAIELYETQSSLYGISFADLDNHDFEPN